ncbi:hypothetical protein M2351_005180 [Azospirillum canadense]|nr:hypothetical protein [Azospirillum canadense]
MATSGIGHMRHRETIGAAERLPSLSLQAPRCNKLTGPVGTLAPAIHSASPAPPAACLLRERGGRVRVPSMDSGNELAPSGTEKKM